MPNVLAAIAAFGAMIFFHELGHFLVGKRAGVRVQAFAIGFGPKIIGWRRGETLYTLNLLPFGGYVKMEGEDGAEPAGEGSFRTRSVGARMGIIVAGPAMNLLLAVAILTLAAGTGGIPTGVSARVASVDAGWPAKEAGIQVGDEIVAIDGRSVTDGEDVVKTIHESAGKPLVLTVRRGTEERQVNVTPRLDPDLNVGRIGFRPEAVLNRPGPVGAVLWGVQRTGQLIVLLVGAIGTLVSQGMFFRSLGGPVAAGCALVQTAATGFQSFLHMSAFLSVIIGVFNLLPIPALDGGRLAFLVGEAVRGRPVLDERREGLVHMVGLVLLLALIAGLTFRDVGRILGTNGC